MILNEAAREQMILQQVRGWDVLDERVLDVMRRVPRERFVPAAWRELAFTDTDIPLGHDARMLAPKVVGRVLQALEIGAGDRVLEIGTGSGFLTACLAAQGASVRSLELHADLAAAARERLGAIGVANAEVVTGDVYGAGVLGGDSYDVVAVTGSLPLDDERFQRRLAIGGRMFVVIGEDPIMAARLVRRVSEREWVAESLFETCIVPLVGARRRDSFRF
jgi:protein-L-isoaspartate(D-aspartate) O-methyltransferase